MIKTRLKIRTYGDPVLRKKAAPVKTVGPAERMLIHAMLETIADKETDIGLAAPQVGVSKRIFVIDLPGLPPVFVNPKISHAQGQQTMEEGCLSFPGITFSVKRPQKIIVDYIDENNEPQRIECQDFLARVVLHENDHLEGKLIVDYALKEEREIKKGALDALSHRTSEDLKVR